MRIAKNIMPGRTTAGSQGGAAPTARGDTTTTGAATGTASSKQPGLRLPSRVVAGAKLLGTLPGGGGRRRTTLYQIHVLAAGNSASNANRGWLVCRQYEAVLQLARAMEEFVGHPSDAHAPVLSRHKPPDAGQLMATLGPVPHMPASQRDEVQESAVVGLLAYLTRLLGAAPSSWRAPGLQSFLGVATEAAELQRTGDHVVHLAELAALNEFSDEESDGDDVSDEAGTRDPDATLSRCASTLGASSVTSASVRPVAAPPVTVVHAQPSTAAPRRPQPPTPPPRRCRARSSSLPRVDTGAVSATAAAAPAGAEKEASPAGAGGGAGGGAGAGAGAGAGVGTKEDSPAHAIGQAESSKPVPAQQLQQVLQDEAALQVSPAGSCGSFELLTVDDAADDAAPDAAPRGAEVQTATKVHGQEQEQGQPQRQEQLQEQESVQEKEQATQQVDAAVPGESTMAAGAPADVDADVDDDDDWVMLESTEEMR